MRLRTMGVLLGLATATAGAGAARPAAQPGPTLSAPPSVTGAARVGTKLSASSGTWTGAGTIAYGFQWYRCDATGAKCSTVRGATAKTYTLGASDAGHTMGLAVRATDPAGTASAYASLVGPVATPDATLFATAQPRVTGRAATGEQLRVDNGTWSGAPSSFAYQWERCNGNGRVCRPIAGATASAYIVRAGDGGRSLACVVEAAAGTTRRTAFSTAVPVSAGPGLPAGATPLRGGTYSIPVSSVSLPERLIVSAARFAPPVLRSTAAFSGRFTVVDTRGYFVRGALVLVDVYPYGLVRGTKERPTGDDGTVTITFRPTAKLNPAEDRQLLFFVRARKAGENLLAGVSTRRLFLLRVRPATN